MIEIAVITSGQYAPWAATAIRSLLDRHSPDELRLNVVHDGSIDASTEARLKGFVEDNGGELQIHSDTSRIRTLPAHDRFGHIVWLTFLLPDLLPGSDRVLYLDADTFVVDRLDELWSTDLGDAPLAAIPNVVEPAAKQHLRNIGIAEGSSYLNSGVILLDLKQLRAEGMWQMLERLVAQRGNDLLWADQDALNVIYEGRWLPLHPRWNAMNSLWAWAEWSREVFGTQTVEEATTDPAIVHFEGPSINKPWNYLSLHPWKDAYRETLARTPWAETPIEGRTAATRFIARLPKKWRHRAYYELGRVKRRLMSKG